MAIAKSMMKDMHVDDCLDLLFADSMDDSDLSLGGYGNLGSVEGDGHNLCMLVGERFGE